MNRKLKAKIVENFGSQAEFSMHVPEHESVISRIVMERQKLRNPDRKKIWAKVLKCKVDDIF